MMDYATVQEMTDSYKSIRARLRGIKRNVVVGLDKKMTVISRNLPKSCKEPHVSKEDNCQELEGDYNAIILHEMAKLLKDTDFNYTDLKGHILNEKNYLRKLIIACCAARGVPLDFMSSFFEASRNVIATSLTPEIFSTLKLPPDYGVKPIKYSTLKTLDKLIFEVAAKHNLTMLLLKQKDASQLKKAGVLQARYEFSYRAYRETIFTFPQIADFLNVQHTAPRYGALKHAEANGLSLSSVKKLKAKKND